MEEQVDLFTQVATKTVDPTGTDFSGDDNFTNLNSNVSSINPMDFISTFSAFALSGMFLWSALLITCFQVQYVSVVNKI